MKILVFGRIGQLGSALAEVLSDCYETRFIDQPELDLTAPESVRDHVQTYQPSIVINAAAYTAVDRAETEPELAHIINARAPGSLACACDEVGAVLIHYSTDYVFDGENGPYSEDDPVCPLSVYGETKLESERILLNHNPNHLVIRGNVIYDDSETTKASFLNWVVNSLKEKQEIQVVNDQVNNPTWTKSMADIIALCIEKDLSGIVHWGDADHLNRYDFAIKIAEKYVLDSKLIKAITTEELNQAAPRPLKSGLKSDKLVQALNVVPPSIDECLNAILERNAE